MFRISEKKTKRMRERHCFVAVQELKKMCPFSLSLSPSHTHTHTLYISLSLAKNGSSGRYRIARKGEKGLRERKKRERGSERKKRERDRVVKEWESERGREEVGESGRKEEKS